MEIMQHSYVFSEILSRRKTDRTFYGDPVWEFTLSCGHTRDIRAAHCDGITEGSRMGCEHCPTPPEVLEKLKAWEPLLSRAAAILSREPSGSP